MRFADRTLLVTGAGGSIGAEICRQLAAEGAALAITDVLPEPLAALEAELCGGSTAVHAQAFDGTDAARFAAFVKTATDTVGTPTGLVTVAGRFEAVDFLDSGPEQWERMVAANLATAMVAARTVAPGMVTAGGGSIVNFASTAGEYGSIRPAAAYAAAKGAVIAFTKSLARELSPQGVRVNAVSPGPVDTGMFAAGADEEQIAAVRREGASRTLIGRMGTPWELARAVAFLSSADAGYVTGEVLRVNGGSLL